VSYSPAGRVEVTDHQPSPSDVLSYRELLEQVRASLTPEELQIGDLRGQGMPWEEIAHRLGGSSQARRMQLARALERVARQLRRTNADAPA
jgi:DNA-directed RNA polymerase specialized sigma24 family protein